MSTAADIYTAEREADKKKQQDFLAYVSHELRTPLNGMIGLAHALIETEANKGRQKHLKMIQSSAQRLVGIVNSIMDITALRDGKMELKPVDNCDLKEICEEVYQLMLIAVDKNNKKIKKDTVDLQLEVDSTAPCIQGDKERITQIIFNLTNNALKFTAAGFVKIAVKNEPDTGTVLASVSDSGKGIKPENLKKIFEPFGQEEEGKGGGLGLGLSIVTKIADLHGGDVWVESDLGKGSAFFVRMPLKMNPKAAVTAGVPAENKAVVVAAALPMAAGLASASGFQSGGSQTSRGGGSTRGGGRRSRFGSHTSHAAAFRSREALASVAPGAEVPIAEEPTGGAPEAEAEDMVFDSAFDFGGQSHVFEARRVAKEKTLRVVLVESEDGEVEVFGETLKQENIKHELTWFRDAYTALDHLENVAVLPDMVFVSIDLPGLNGFQFVEEVRQFCPPELPVILTASQSGSGALSGGIRVEAVSRLATSVVQKEPWDKKELSAVVKAVAINTELMKLALNDHIHDEVFKLMVPERRRLAGATVGRIAVANAGGEAGLPGQVRVSVAVAKIKELDVIRSILSLSQYRTLLGKVQGVFDDKLQTNDCFRVESPSDEYVVASDAPECVERVLEYLKQCIAELREIRVAGKQLEFHIGVDVGYVDGIFMNAVGKATLPRFLVTGSALTWAHLLQLTGFANHAHISEEVFVEIEKEFSGSGIYDCYPRGVLRGQKTYIMRNASNEDPGQFSHASLDFLLMHALNFREGAEEVIQQLEADVKNLQLRVDLMKGGKQRDTAMKLIEQELLKTKTISPVAILAVIADPVEQLLNAVQCAVNTLPSVPVEERSGELSENVELLISEFEQMMSKTELTATSLRETRRAARQVAATTRVSDSTGLVVTTEAAGVLGNLLDDLMDDVGEKMRRIVEAEVASNSTREIHRRFEKIVMPLQEQVDFLASEIDNLQVVLASIEDNYTKFKLTMPSVLVNLDKTNSAVIKSLHRSGDSDTVAHAQVKHLQSELLALRAVDSRPTGGGDSREMEKLRKEVQFVRQELLDAVEFRHIIEKSLQLTQTELEETRLNLKLHQQLLTASRVTSSSK